MNPNHLKALYDTLLPFQPSPEDYWENREPQGQYLSGIDGIRYALPDLYWQALKIAHAGNVDGANDFMLRELSKYEFIGNHESDSLTTTCDYIYLAGQCSGYDHIEKIANNPDANLSAQRKLHAQENDGLPDDENDEEEELDDELNDNFRYGDDDDGSECNGYMVDGEQASHDPHIWRILWPIWFAIKAEPDQWPTEPEKKIIWAILTWLTGANIPRDFDTDPPLPPVTELTARQTMGWALAYALSATGNHILDSGYLYTMECQPLEWCQEDIILAIKIDTEANRIREYIDKGFDICEAHLAAITSNLRKIMKGECRHDECNWPD